MKKGESPEVSTAWWKRAQPKGLKSAGKLDAALKDYEDAKKAIEKGDADAAKDAFDALGMIEKAASDIVAEASKAKAVQEMQDTADCLKKMSRFVDAERKWVDEHAEGDDEGMFSDEEVYKAYLLAGLKRLRSSGELNFGMVLGKKAENHRIAVHKSKSGKALASMLAKETGLRQFTFGTAKPDPDEGAGVMMLYLEGRQLPGMGKKGERMLKKFKPLPFTKMRLFVEGKEVSDLADPEDTDSDDDDARPDAGALTARLEGLIVQLKALANPAVTGDLARLASRAGAAIRGGNLGDAETALDALEAGIRAAPPGPGTGNGTTQPNGDASVQDAKKRVGLDTGSKAWAAARKRIEEDVAKLRKAILDTYGSLPIAGEIESRYTAKVTPLLQALDGELSAKLVEASKEEDPVRRPLLLDEVRAVMKRYQDYVQDNELIDSLDANPFTAIAIRQTVNATLAALTQVAA